MIVKEIMVKGIVTRSNLPGTDYVVNPYVGCQHGCIYCYAEFMKRFTDHHEKWGSFADVKINALEVLGNPERYRGKSILFSSVTDPYHPIEAKYRLTRRLLEALVPAQPRIEMLTKSRLVTRDIDVLKRFDDAMVGVSLGILDEKLSRELEPVAAAPRLRIEALKRCKAAGLRTYVFLSPILPHLTEIEGIIDFSSEHVDFLMFENLNVRPHNQARIFGFIRRRRPDLLEGYRDIYLKGEHAYWDGLRKRITAHCGKLGKEAHICFHHGGFKK